MADTKEATGNFIKLNPIRLAVCGNPGGDYRRLYMKTPAYENVVEARHFVFNRCINEGCWSPLGFP